MSIAKNPSRWAARAALGLIGAACRQSNTPRAATIVDSMAAHVATSSCARDSLRPATAAPAAGLWSGQGGRSAARISVLIGPATTDADHPRITRRVEALETRPGADALRLATETASVRLELLPRYPVRAARETRPESSELEPAAVYAITQRALLAAYEPCTASADEPRVRYLRRDERGAVATDVMLHPASADGTGR